MRRKQGAGLAVTLAVLGVSLIPAQADAGTVKSDFVFIVDATGSMSGEIAGVRSGFSSFVSGLNSAGVDARYAVVVYGGSPELVLDFTSDATAAQTALNKITIGARAGFQNNHNLNPEAGLEAIRMVLGAAPYSELVNNNIPQDGFLNFRGDARKNLILATDEDSDRPWFAANRFTGQNTNEPPGFPNAAWQAEVDATALAVIRNLAFVNLLVSHNGPSEHQYGDYAYDVSDANFLNFDPDATLAALQAAGLSRSLQAQVLNAGLIGRTFNVAGANNSDFVANFYAAKIEETTDNPLPVVPLPPAAWLGLAMLGGLGLARRARRRTN